MAQFKRDQKNCLSLPINHYYKILWGILEGAELRLSIAREMWDLLNQMHLILDFCLYVYTMLCSTV